MSTRRDPPTPRTRPAAPTQDSTALMERPMFSDADLHGAHDAGDGDHDVWSDEDTALGDSARAVEAARIVKAFNVGDNDSDGETTDPKRVGAGQNRGPARAGGNDDADAATGRFDLDALDDLDNSLPSAHISELDISDLDGDVAEGGAPTAIMQLPPEMMAHHRRESGTDSGPDASAEVVHANADDEVDLRRWSAGPPGARHDMPVAGAPPPSAELGSDAGHGATMPALSLDAIRAAAEGLHDVGAPAGVHTSPLTPLPMAPLPLAPLMPMPMPMPPSPHGGAAQLRADDVSRAAPPGALRALVEDALSAVTNAQSVAGHAEDSVLQRNLSRAVDALSRLLEHVD